MTVEGEGIDKGKETGGETGQEDGKFRAQFPADLRDHEAFKPYRTIGDLGKAHIDLVGRVKELDGMSAKVTELEGKVKDAVPKLTDKSTPEEKEAYFRAVGRPDKPEEYELPKPERGESDPGMVKWAQGVFHKHGLTVEQAKGLGQDWNGFVTGVVEAQDKLANDEMVANEKKFHGEFKSEDEYKAGYELARRFWNKVTGTDFNEVYKEPEAWQKPLFMNFIFKVAKMTGEDTSPLGRSSGEEVKEGMVYDKSPPPPNT